MKNTNCLEGMMCPKCGNTDRFDIDVIASAKLYDDGVSDYTGAEFDDNHTASCPDCDWDGQVAELLHPGFDVTFDTYTEESVEQGEANRRGWWMPGEWLHEEHPGELAFEFPPDYYDTDEHDSISDAIVEWAVNILRHSGACHPNCHPSEYADWWGTEGNEVISYETGETILRSFHFRRFTNAQREEINRRMAA